jgi:shikimate kinase
MRFGRPGRPVFLAGMMGAGKSTVGRILAARQGAVFVDLDRRIELLSGRTVADLFGEDPGRFRARERDALGSLLAEPGFAGRAVVVALGGGTLLDGANAAAVRAVGPTVFLDASPAVLRARLGADERGRRPLMADADPAAVEARLADLLAQRRSSYDACDLRVNAEGDPEAIAERVLEMLADRAEHAD